MKRLLQLLFLGLPALGHGLEIRASEANITGIEKKKVPVDSAVQGFVVDHVTKKPVSDVVVYLYSKQGRREIKSDASGYFAFPQLLPGEFTLIVEGDGYKSYRKELVVPKEGLMFKLALQEEEEEGADTWNPFRVLFDR